MYLQQSFKNAEIRFGLLSVHLHITPKDLLDRCSRNLKLGILLKFVAILQLYLKLNNDRVTLHEGMSVFQFVSQV